MESEPERLLIDFGDGVSALDRTMRAITMLADGAIQKLIDLGWSRKTVNLSIDDDDPLPCWVTLRKKRAFEIRAVSSSEGRIVIEGEWLEAPEKPGIIDRFWGT